MLQLPDYSWGKTVHECPEVQVRLVTHLPSGQQLLAKLPVSDSPSPRIVGRLVHEHLILGKLCHVPGVIQAHALIQQGGSAALILHCAGMASLDQLLAVHGKLPVALALRVACELCRVLDGVHRAGVIHKDLKPQSVLIADSCAQVVLADFGIASELAQEATEAAIPESLEGTLAYISPEQTGRTARGLDARADLYSLGVLLFELLSGRKPFVEKDALALVHAHLAKAPPALASLVPGVPDMVARILEHCLEKTQEKRYQTAKGLLADLERCLESLGRDEPIEPFIIGQKDFSPRLHLPETLVSREKECQVIADAFERAASGAVEVLLVGGPSGVGKTTLVRSVYRQIAKAGRGLLLSGKHDQLGRSAPYAALAQAFSGMMASLAASPKPPFEAWRGRLERALGPLSRIIADLIPELEWLMGPLPAVPVVPAEMAYNRIKLSWIEFVRAVTDASPPLVLFLDDLQWVDAASLELLKTLLTDLGRKQLLVIAAFRDNEVDAGHPLWKWTEAVAKSGVPTPRLSVGPLNEASVKQWLGGVLLAEPERVEPLAGALFRKTRGNPFFLGQLLLELHRQKRIRRSAETGVWLWDQDAVERAAVTDNVVELMRSKVVELPESTQELLGQAACAGHSFSFSELAVLSGLSAPQVAQELWPALLDGLVIPSDGQYREAQALAQSQNKCELDAGYRFLHDRVQQAFYERIAPEQRVRTHLQIGRRMQNLFEQQGGSNQKLLELARHLNLGSEALESTAERTELARLNLKAAKAAKVNGSYRLQANLVELAQQLLGEPGWAWKAEPKLSVELALERIEADFMLREFDGVHSRAQELLTLPVPVLARLAAQELRVRTCRACGQYAEGAQLGLAALAERGITYPETKEACTESALALLAECEDWLDAHPEGFSAMPAVSSPEHFLGDALEAATILCAAIGNRPALATLAMVRHTQRVIQRGFLTPVTPYLLATVAQARSAVLGDYFSGRRWTQEAERAALRLSSPFLPQCANFQGVYATYHLPVEHSRAYYQTTLRVALASGSFQGTSMGLIGELLHLEFWRGCPLEQVARTERSQRELMARAGDTVGQHYFALVASFINFLCTPRNASSGDDWQLEGAKPWLGASAGVVAQTALVLEAHVYLAFGEASKALMRADEAELFRPSFYGFVWVTDIPLWRGLAAAQCWSPALPPEESARLEAMLVHAIERFRSFSSGCAANFLHKLRLLEAEQARIHGQTDAAMSYYDQAITLAQKERFLPIEALAAQLCAQYHHAAKRERIAALYFQQARSAYSRWNARAIVSHLEARYPELLSAEPAPSLQSPTADLAGSVALDIHTSVRAAQTLSSELNPDRVVGRLMELMLESAGAQHGALVLRERDSLVLVARLSVTGARIETGLSEPLEQSPALATKLIQYVARSGEAVVVSDAQTDTRFADDPYLAAQPVRSLLGLPLLHRGALVGVLYLEHREASAAFPGERISFLSVLASHAAIAVENALLYRNVEAQVHALQARNQEIEQLNDELRRQIRQRSRRLMQVLSSRDSARPASSQLPKNSLLGDCYRVIRLLGKGGMGAVYEVERTSDGRRLAAKVLHSNLDRNALSRFAREAQILASLKHPSLISIFDMDVTPEGLIYIVMELVKGSSLAEQRARFGDVAWGLCILAQVAEALAVLHGQSVIHRDLKPENILIMAAEADAPPVAKLADFGISIMLGEAQNGPHSLTTPASASLRWEHTLASQPPAELGSATVESSMSSALMSAKTEPGVRITVPLAQRAPLRSPSLGLSLKENVNRSRQLLTETGVIIGTPRYMAPELLHGSKNAQLPSDVFSLGVIAFELLTGSMPFDHPAVLSESVDGQLGISSRLRQCSGLEPSLVAPLASCLALDPAQRPSAQQLAKLLQPFRSKAAG